MSFYLIGLRNEVTYNYALKFLPTKTDVILCKEISTHRPVLGKSLGRRSKRNTRITKVGACCLYWVSSYFICRNASLITRDIGRVRKYIFQAGIERLVLAFITSRLDYCNSLLYGVPACGLGKLQRMQNTTARLVTGAKRAQRPLGSYSKPSLATHK